MGLPPVLRNNLDYVFIFRNNIVKERQKIYDNYAGMFANFEVFNQVMNQCTENYECLVIDCKTQSNKLKIKFLVQTKIHFKMCSTEMWNMQSLEDQRSLQGLGVNDDEDDEKYDAGVFAKKKIIQKLMLKNQIINLSGEIRDNNHCIHLCIYLVYNS